MSKLTQAEVNKIITEHSTNRYCMEYKVFLSNHISHGIIALYKLGADTKRINQFIDWYNTKLEAPKQQPEQVSLPEELNGQLDVTALLGKRISFFPLFHYYDDLYKNKCSSSLEDFISEYFPSLSDGLGCALLHALIHMGYGYNVRNPQVVVEGMAYLHHSYSPILIKQEDSKILFGSGTKDILEVLKEVKQDAKLIEYMTKEAERPDWMPWYPGNAQKRVNILGKDRGDALMKYILQIKLPDFFNVASASLDDVLALMDWVIDCAIIVFQCSEKRNDFFFLHGVTGAWSLKQLITAFKSTTQIKEAMACVKWYLIVLFSTYLTQDSPIINLSHLEETTNRSWDDIIQEVVQADRDEHVYKLVEVCRERCMSVNDAKKEQMYKCASLLSISKPFF